MKNTYLPFKGHWIYKVDTDPINIPVMDGIYHIPSQGHKGAFGTVRKNHVHEGVDIYCREGAVVRAIRDGMVTGAYHFTGEKAGSPWWNDTECLLVYSPEIGTINYGEIKTSLQAGDLVKAGDPIGEVAPVIKNPKGYPTSMLHLELYEGFRAFPVKEWALREATPPAGLRNIAPFLKVTLAYIQRERRKRV